MPSKETKEEKRLRAPAHLALIPDGNRRWSRNHRFSLVRGYKSGIEKFMSFSMWAKEFGVKTLTVWMLSTENIKSRSSMELKTLYHLYIMWARDKKTIDMLLENGARIKVIGNLGLVPKGVRDALRYIETSTKRCEDFTINLLVGYGGKDDLMYAFRNAGKGVDSADFGKRIRTSSLPDVDLIIRTSGEHRLSGFLPWQSDYSELYFARKYWPDIKREDLRRAINSFSARERRFGR